MRGSLCEQENGKISCQSMRLKFWWNFLIPPGMRMRTGKTLAGAHSSYTKPVRTQ